MILIDADKLKADLAKAISKNEDMDCLDFLRVASVIDAKPTAYDPDKVLDQLWDASFERFGCDTGMGGEQVVNMDDAIEIVKGGGNDDLLIDRAKSKSGERIPYDGKWK